ncbi:MAG: hypothetical protein KatS3mg011_0082 [Acidimicrobiia bacterium]|nr:MAG: hypothetical protein KatS3mg011_0082 [Acidimicrobiia bacterium]
MIWLLGALLVLGWRPRRLPKLVGTRRDDPVLATARLLSLGLTAGLPLASALHRTTEETGVGRELAALTRRATAVGLAQALVETEGELAGLARLLARAQLSGAPLTEAVGAFIRARTLESRTERLRRIRTLPVTLLVPLSLMLLPGFVVLVMGPVVATQISELWSGVGP